MKYKQAMACATAVDGIIKCTWAKVYDEDGNTVFTLVNSRFRKQTLIPESGDYYHGEESDVTEDENNHTNVNLSLAWTTDYVYEAVVTCTEYVDGYRVPVKLSQGNVLKAFEHSLVNVEQTLEKIDIMMGLTKDQAYRDVLTTQKDKLEQLRNRRLQHIEDIKAGKDFWVKVKAFNWYPLNAKIPSEDSVKKAKAELDMAKTLLAASGAAILF